MNRPSEHRDDPCLLLVEGGDDRAVAIHLRSAIDNLPEFCADERGSVEKVLAAIRPELLRPGRRALGIVVDANDSWKGRWEAIRGRLDAEGVDVPKQPDENGTIIEATNRLPRVGVWIMPDNRSDGELEDFLLTMLPEDDPVWPRSEVYIDGIPAHDRKFKDGKTHRAKLHAWLATRREPRQSGLAIKTGDLRVDGVLAMKFAEWLRRLFGDLE